MQQIVDLLQFSCAALELVFDNAPSPGIGASIANSARNTLQPGELEDLSGQRQLERIERDGVWPLKVTVAIAKPPDLHAARQCLHSKQSRRHSLQGAGELNVDVGFAFSRHGPQVITQKS